MDRARRAGLAALIVVLIASLAGPASVPAAAAVVDWPTSTLVVSEVQTGGASASDEFVEIANQGSTSVDLVGLELVYATASGSTVTRKASWDALDRPRAGRRLLLANASGTFAAAGRPDVLGWVRCDRRRRRAAGRRRRRRRFGRLGRCDQRLRRGRRGERAAGGLEPRATARRSRRQRDRHERQRGRLVRPGLADPAGSRLAAGPVRDAHADAGSTPTPAARPRRRRRPRLRRRGPRPTRHRSPRRPRPRRPTPPRPRRRPDPDAQSDPDPDAQSDADPGRDPGADRRRPGPGGRVHGHRRGRPDHRSSASSSRDAAGSSRTSRAASPSTSTPRSPAAGPRGTTVDRPRVDLEPVLAANAAARRSRARAGSHRRACPPRSRRRPATQPNRSRDAASRWPAP